MSQDARLADLLLQWEEAEERGEPVSAEQLCRDCPTLVDELQRQIDLLRRVSPLLDLAGSSRPAPPTLPGFEVLEELKGGGMGVVYRARDLSLGRVVAIKMPRRTMLGDVSRRRFQREARVLAQFKHPHLVPVHQAGLLRDHPFFVMAFVPGGNLAEHRTSFSAPCRAAELIEKVARAVHYAHERNVLHRDLKPANILLDEHGQPLVADFGIAALNDPDEAAPQAAPPGADTTVDLPSHLRLTVTDTILGTPSYMAPEQFEGKTAGTGPATDVWALGVVLYELLTGRLPFEGQTRAETEALVRQAAPPRPTALRPELDQELEAVVLRCLERQPARRYQTAEALAGDLERWRRSASGWWRGLRPFRRHPWWTLASALAVLAVFLIAWPYLRPRSEEERHQARLREARDRLAKGLAIDLLADSGPPVSYLVRSGRDGIDVSTADDGTFTVEAQGLALVELLPKMPLARFRFQAEVRELTCWGTADVGIYYSHHQAGSAQRPHHLCGYLSFADVGPYAHYFKNEQGQLGSWEKVNILHYVAPGGPPRGEWAVYDGAHRFYLPPSLPPGPWRRLSVEVTPEVVTASMDGKPLRPFSQEPLGAWIARRGRKDPQMTPFPAVLNPGGGLGLYLNHAMASFRRCRIEPIEQP
jgi:serine/threonine-protein kinase